MDVLIPSWMRAYAAAQSTYDDPKNPDDGIVTSWVDTTTVLFHTDPGDDRGQT